MIMGTDTTLNILHAQATVCLGRACAGTRLSLQRLISSQPALAWLTAGRIRGASGGRGMSLTPVQIWPDSNYHDNVQLPIYRIYVARFSGLEPFHHLPEHARRGRPIALFLYQKQPATNGAWAIVRALWGPCLPLARLL